MLRLFEIHAKIKFYQVNKLGNEDHYKAFKAGTVVVPHICESKTPAEVEKDYRTQIDNLRLRFFKNEIQDVINEYSI